MTDLIDISMPLQPRMPIWPGDAGFALKKNRSISAGDSVNVSELACGVHSGTHVDAPYHFLADGATVDKMSLEKLVGRTTVAYLPEVQSITVADLVSLNLPSNAKRLLLRTRNSDFSSLGATAFRPDFTALTPEAACWLVDRGMLLIGIDYLSVQQYKDGSSTHRILLESGVVILEGLSLTGVNPGEYELICLPLCLVGADGAPARAILRCLS